MADNAISHSELLKLLHYSPETGVFTWKIHVNSRARPGWVAGSLVGEGYWRIKVGNRSTLAHRLAWFYVNGTWPDRAIDHIDANKLNNRISNLRLASVKQNSANRKIGKNNSSGFKGIQARPNGRWRASYESDGKWYSLGSYGSREEASDAYMASLKERHGEFARAA